MNIKFEGSYKSINKLDWNNIPSLVVITGKNGVGKTHLLELIYNSFLKHSSLKTKITCSVRFKEEEIRYIDTNWKMSNFSPMDLGQINAFISNIYNQKNSESSRRLLQKISKKLDKPQYQITRDDIEDNLPVDFRDYQEYKNKVHEGIETIFYTYFTKEAEYKVQKPPKSDKEIRKKLGTPPWEVLNSIFIKVGFSYIVLPPTKLVGHYQCELEKINHPNIKIRLDSLSSGERMIALLVFWVYNTNYENRTPKLILMDEPDAHLHPSMLRMFFNTIDTILVKEYDIRVILTTHSPSSVAIVDEECLFEMSASEPRVKKLQSKQYGINLLTEGIVTVVPNTKYVLVEDEDDARFYNNIFEILKNGSHLNTEIGIRFIPISNKKNQDTGGKTVVRSWLEKLQSDTQGNIAFQGLVDLDGESEPPKVKGLHYLKRYSLENYLYDPIIIYASALHLDNLDSKELLIEGVNITQKNEHNITTLSQDKLQKITDYVFESIKLDKSIKKDSTQVKFISKNNEIKLYYPNWFLYERGKDIEKNIRRKYKAAIELKRILNTFERHNFIPMDLIQIFREIQTTF